MRDGRDEHAEVPLSHGGVWTNENGKFLNVLTWVGAPVALSVLVAVLLALAYFLG